MKKKTWMILTAVLAVVIAAGMCFAWRKKRVTVLFTNDVHAHLESEMSYAAVAYLKKQLEARGRDVIVADAGDFLQGAVYGAYDQGKHVISLMNAARYDVAALGNHEFDYGMFRMFQAVDEADFSVISCNFLDERGATVLEPSKIIEKGGLRIAFIGISTPLTMTSTTPAYFQDEKGNLIYSFRGLEDPGDLYDAVQKAIDEVRNSCDYVIALGHLGSSSNGNPLGSEKVVEHTKGLDAFIDGHSHSVVQGKAVTDLSGKKVLIFQAGAAFECIGKLTLSKSGVSGELISGLTKKDETISAMEASWKEEVEADLGEPVAETELFLSINDPKEPGRRIVRNRETALADLITDAYYHYLNRNTKTGCDAVILGGGGIRADLPAGLVTKLDCKSVTPFGNVVMVSEVTGETILDALEFVARNLRPDDSQEAGRALLVSGLSYEVDLSVKSTVGIDENGFFSAAPTGPRRVKNVKIYQRKTGVYEDLDPEKTYYLGGTSYYFLNSGDGLAMFRTAKIVAISAEDSLVLAAYLASFAPGENGIPKIASENSPLASLKNFLLDYENPYGSGRIRFTAPE